MKTSPKDARVISLIAWYVTRLILVLTLSLLMSFVYYSISRDFETFWEPLLAPFKSLQNCASLCFSCHRSDVKQEKNIKETTVDSTDTNPEQQFTEHSLNSLNIDDSNQLTCPALNRQDTVTSYDDGIDRIDLQSANENIKLGLSAKRRENQLKVTITFFYVTFFFTLVALPTSLVILGYIFYARSGGADIHISSKYYFLVSRTMYQLVFLLNPFLYSRRNPYIIERIHKGKGRCCCCTICCCMCF